jgi:arsenate reductase (thioredoxin)
LIERRNALSSLKVSLPLLFIILFAVISVIQNQAAPRKRILVLCTGNSARSQMAEGILRSLDPQLEVFSAGTEPASHINPNAVRVMQELNIDISQGKPKAVQQFLGQSFDYVITVCDDADKNCPRFSGKVGKRLHIGFVDPARASGSEEAVLTVFRRVRDEIKARFTDFYNREGKQGNASSPAGKN